MAILGAVLNEGGFRRHQIFIEDLGTGGLKFRTEVAYRKHDVVEILIHLEETAYTAKVEIRHVVADWFGYVCGVQFLQPDPALIRSITLLVAHIAPEDSAIPA